MTAEVFFLKTQFQGSPESKHSQTVNTNHHCPLPRLGQKHRHLKGTENIYLSALLLTLRERCKQKENPEWREPTGGIEKGELEPKQICLETTPVRNNTNYIARPTRRAPTPYAKPVSGYTG